mmetsp:Transcript_3192/g.9085  ORF Transcript_3192/g.9085 Transcript_3192/m.9085 type:complete len:313 (+) Transcript_3192:2876-3814(+)
MADRVVAHRQRPGSQAAQDAHKHGHYPLVPQDAPILYLKRQPLAVCLAVWVVVLDAFVFLHPRLLMLGEDHCAAPRHVPLEPKEVLVPRKYDPIIVFLFFFLWVERCCTADPAGPAAARRSGGRGRLLHVDHHPTGVELRGPEHLLGHLQLWQRGCGEVACAEGQRGHPDRAPHSLGYHPLDGGCPRGNHLWQVGIPEQGHADEDFISNLGICSRSGRDEPPALISTHRLPHQHQHLSGPRHMRLQLCDYGDALRPLSTRRHHGLQKLLLSDNHVAADHKHIWGGVSQSVHCQAEVRRLALPSVRARGTAAE